MQHSETGPPTSGDHLRHAMTELYAVRQFLEAPYELTAKDWQQAYDGLGPVLLAIERLTEMLAARCPTADHTAELAAVHDLLHDANRRLPNNAGTTPA
jgi:hypothetical protein